MTPTPGTTYASPSGLVRVMVDTVSPPDRHGFFLVKTCDPTDPMLGGLEITGEEWAAACQHFGLTPETPTR